MNIALKKKITSLVMASVTVTFAAVIGVNCSGFAVSSTFDSLNGSLGSGDDKSIPVGFLSSEQILKSMISVAGIENLGDLTTSDDNDIDSTYQQRKGSLPSVQDLSAATGPTLIAITNLAASVCNKAVNRDVASQSQDRVFFSEVDFSKGIGAQSATAFRGGFDRMARNAWRREATAEENNSIDTFVTEFRTGADLNATAQTRLLAVSVCTAVLSSADALTY